MRRMIRFLNRRRAKHGSLFPPTADEPVGDKAAWQAWLDQRHPEPVAPAPQAAPDATP